MGSVILVNEQDVPVGSMEKLEAHQKGVLHRAFSVVLRDEQNRILLQKRATHKYHSGGLWTNTCCSHPEPGEETSAAAQRRLREELGIRSTILNPIFSFTYRSAVGADLTEYEFDHVYLGNYSGSVELNPDEVAEAGYFTAAEISNWMTESPEQFTAWFRLLFPKLLPYLN